MSSAKSAPGGPSDIRSTGEDRSGIACPASALAEGGIADAHRSFDAKASGGSLSYCKYLVHYLGVLLRDAKSRSDHKLLVSRQALERCGASRD